jgi:hypothetical protein
MAHWNAFYRKLSGLPTSSLPRKSEVARMSRFRFTIAGLIVFIVICGAGFAALKEATDLWEHAVFSLTLLAMVTAVLLAIHRRAARRAFWLGFALFGGCYLALSTIPPIETRMISSQVFVYLHSKLPGQQAQTVSYLVTSRPTGNSGSKSQMLTLTSTNNQLSASGKGSVQFSIASNGLQLTRWGGSTENFVNIGHSLLALLLAWLGGLVSRWLWRSSAIAGSASQVDAWSSDIG